MTAPPKDISVPVLSAIDRTKSPPVSTSFGSNNSEYQPQGIGAAHPVAFEEVSHDNEKCERQQEPRSSGVAVYHAPNGVEGCYDEDYEESKADVPHLQHRIQIAIVGGRHGLDPTW